MYMRVGEITAKVWYSKKEKMDLKQVSVNKTGNTQKKYCIKFPQIIKNNNGQYNDLISAYFSNDIEGIEEILLSNSEFKNLKELESRFSNKNISEEMEK